MFLPMVRFFFFCRRGCVCVSNSLHGLTPLAHIQWDHSAYLWWCPTVLSDMCWSGSVLLLRRLDQRGKLLHPSVSHLIYRRLDRPRLPRWRGRDTDTHVCPHMITLTRRGEKRRINVAGDDRKLTQVKWWLVENQTELLQPKVKAYGIGANPLLPLLL